MINEVCNNGGEGAERFSKSCLDHRTRVRNVITEMSQTCAVVYRFVCVVFVQVYQQEVNQQEP